MNAEDVEKIVRVSVRQALAESSIRNEKVVSLKAADVLIEKVTQAAKERGMRIVAAVADAGGNPVAVRRMDGAYVASYDIALNKAYTSAALKMSTAKLSKLAAPGGELYGIQHTNGGKIVVFGGGEPLLVGGEVVGALGVSGGTLKQDTELAEEGKKVWEDILCR